MLCEYHEFIQIKFIYLNLMFIFSFVYTKLRLYFIATGNYLKKKTLTVVDIGRIRFVQRHCENKILIE